MMRALALVLAAAFVLSVPACATHRDDLARGQRAYEQNAHERALAIFRAMEPNLTRLSPVERARYSYLRGMTDYRIGYRLDARHWLSLAKAIDEQTPGALPSDWETRMNDAVKELNAQVYDDGVDSLANTRNRDGAKGADKSGKSGMDGKKASDDEP